MMLVANAPKLFHRSQLAQASVLCRRYPQTFLRSVSISSAINRGVRRSRSAANKSQTPGRKAIRTKLMDSGMQGNADTVLRRRICVWRKYQGSWQSEKSQKF